MFLKIRKGPALCRGPGVSSLLRGLGPAQLNLDGFTVPLDHQGDRFTLHVPCLGFGQNLGIIRPQDAVDTINQIVHVNPRF